MGSFVSLLPRPPQQNPFQAAEQGQQFALNNQNQLQEQQLRQQQIEEAQTSNQAKQIALDEAQQAQRDQGLVNQAWHDNHGDMTATMAALPGLGVRPQTALNLNNQFAESQNNAAKAGSSALALEAERNNALLGSIEQFQSGVGPNGYPVYQDVPGDKFSQWLTTQAQNGNITPDHAQQMSQQYANGIGSDDLRTLASGLTTHSQALQGAQSIAQTNEANERANQAKVTTDEDWTHLAAQYGQFVNDQPSLDQYRKDLQDRGAPQSLLNRIPATYDDNFRGTVTQLAIPATSMPDWINKQVADTGDKLRVSGTNGAYEDMRSSLPAALRARMPDYSGYDPKAPLTDAQKSEIDLQALTPEQRSQREQNLKQSQALISMYGQRANLYGAQANYNNARANNGGMTPQQQQALKNRADAQYFDLSGKEQSLRQQLAQMQAAANTQQPGAALPTVGGKAVDAKAEVERLKTAIAQVNIDKYGAAGVAGRGAPSYSLQQTLKDLGRENMLPQAPQSQTPQGAPAQSGPQTFTEDDARARAQAYGLDPDEYVKAARAKGLIQ